MGFLDKVAPAAGSFPVVKGKAGQKRPEDLPDPSEFLKYPRHEKMIHLILEKGMNQAEAYKSTAQKPVSNASAATGSSQIFRRPEVRARLEYLRNKVKKAPLAPDNSDSVVSLEDIAKQLSKKIRQGGSDSAFVSACTAAIKILGELNETKEARLDPCILAAHLAQFAGRKGADIAAQVGGLRLLLERMADIMRVTLADIHAAAADTVDMS